MTEDPGTKGNQSAQDRPPSRAGMWARLRGMLDAAIPPAADESEELEDVTGGLRPEDLAHLAVGEPDDPLKPAQEPAPPQWPEQWKAPGAPRKSIPAQAKDAKPADDEPPPWPEHWGIIKPHTPRKQPPKRPKKEEREPVANPWAAGNADATPPSDADPPPWPDQWNTALPPAARPKKQVAAAEAPPRRSEPPSRPSGRKPRVPRSEAGDSSPRTPVQADNDPPAWPAEWAGRLPGSTAPAPPHPARPAPRRKTALPDSLPEPLGWRVLRAVCDPVLTTMGFRRLREYARVDYVPPELRRVPDYDPGAARRIMPLLGLGLLIALLALGAVWAFSLLNPRPSIVDAESSRALLRDAVAKLTAGDVAAARALRDRMRDVDPDSVTLSYFEGYLLASDEGIHQTLARKLGQRTGNRRRTVRNLATLAGYYEAGGDMQRAADLLLDVVRLDPRNLEARLLAASALLATGRNEEAIKQADELDLQGGSSRASSDIRGQAYLAMGYPKAARDEFSAVLAYDSASISARLGLADAFIAEGDFANALTELKQVVAQDPNNVEAYARLGVIHEQVGDFVKAERVYRKAIKMGEHPGALNNLAYLLAVKRNKPREALQYALRARELAPEGAAVLDTLGWIYHLLGQADRAVPLIREAVERDPKNPELRLHLAQVLNASGKRAESLRILERLAGENGETAFHQTARRMLRDLKAAA
ncbi:MAG: tetratricopeptide repeat protein [Armatimonadetes bacterium]|nr:tetratricopeptide repeat protein [Armatimonadota bacterium]